MEETTGYQRHRTTSVVSKPNVDSAALMDGGKKSHMCLQCNKKFSRQDHLRRHSLSHTGRMPYSCLYCNEKFARSDRLRDHYPDCSARMGRDIPKKNQQGRRRRACVACTLSKLRCDGGTPCTGCLRRNIECDISRVQESNSSQVVVSATVQTSLSAESGSTRESVKALLDGGTDKFTESFNLPRISAFMSQYELTSTAFEVADFATPENGNLGDLGPLFHPGTRFWGDPFSCASRWSMNGVEDPSHWPENVIAPEFHRCSDHSQYSEPDPETPQLFLLRESMMRKASDICPDSGSTAELSALIQFLFCRSKVDAFVKSFFENWYPNCPILHPPTFDAAHVSVELLLAIICFGAIYSHKGMNRRVAEWLLDCAEALVFCSEAFTTNRADFPNEGTRQPDDQVLDWRLFEQLQAGYLMVTVQYWAGSRNSKSHAMEVRFSEIIKVTRRSGLINVRHLPLDRISEHRWIRKEMKIRTMNMIRSLDCAFIFYSNYPCRLTLTELDVDLPCDSYMFNSKHPFAEDKFSFSPKGTVADIFQELFIAETAHQDPIGGEEAGRAHAAIAGPPLSGKTQTVLDLFLSIHLLYVFAHTNLQLRFLIPRPLQHRGQNADSTSTSGNALREGDEISLSVKRALKRWYGMWTAVQEKATFDPQCNPGMSALAYNLWLVIRLFADKAESVNLRDSIEKQTQDKLALLKSVM